MKKTHMAIAAAAAMTVISAQTALANDAVIFMKKFYEIADARPLDFETLSGLYADNYVDHHPNPAMPADGPKGLVFKLIADGAPDSSHKIVDILPTGENKAVVIWSHEGTNTNNMFGIPTQDPALPFAIAGIEVWQIVNGKITDLWHVEDIAGLGAQLSPK